MRERDAGYGVREARAQGATGPSQAPDSSVVGVGVGPSLGRAGADNHHGGVDQVAARGRNVDE